MGILNITESKKYEIAEKMQEALDSSSSEEVKQVMVDFYQSLRDEIKQDHEEAYGNQMILAQRGYRQLTPQETNYYNKLIEAGRSANPKQAMVGLIDIMPETIIEDVYKDLTDEHPLLSKINFVPVGYLTKWILNDHTVQTAVWGEINSAITEEITSAFRTIEVTQCKLSAFAVIEKDMLDLGPTFLDKYIRMILKEALLCGLEQGIVNGDGNKKPIGLTRDIHEGVSVSGGVYPKKTPIKVTSFTPKEYGELLANLVVNEKGKKRKIENILLICNQMDYFKRIMPATTPQNSNGTYQNDVFPYKTEVVISNELEDGEAVLCLPKEYFMGIGGSKEGVIEYTDELKFLEDKRVYKIKMYGMGKAYDNTVALLLDISELDPAYITVRIDPAQVVPATLSTKKATK